MTKNIITRIELQALAIDAKPIDYESDYGSERQINAEIKLFDAVKEIISPANFERFEVYALKATPEEAIAFAMSMAMPLLQTYEIFRQQLNILKTRYGSAGHETLEDEEMPITQFFCNSLNVDCVKDGKFVNGVWLCTSHTETRDWLILPSETIQQDVAESMRHAIKAFLAMIPRRSYTVSNESFSNTYDSAPDIAEKVIFVNGQTDGEYISPDAESFDNSIGVFVDPAQTAMMSDLEFSAYIKREHYT